MDYHYTTAISKLLEDVISSTTPDTPVQFTCIKVLYPLIENLMLNSLETKHCITGCMIIELPVEEPENLFSLGTRILNMFTPGKVV